MRLPAAFLALGALLLLPACAHAQGAALLQKPITAGNCATLGSPNLVADSGVGCSNHQVTIADGTHGTILLAPSTLILPNSPAILNNTSAQPLLLTKGVASTATDGKDFYIYRNANYTGGTFGNTATALTVATNAGLGTKAFEWNFLAQLNNYGVFGDAAQDVAAYFIASKFSTGSTWGAVTELIDYGADPAAGSVTDEHDMSATGTDAHNSRVMFDGWVRNAPGSSSTEAAYGIRLNTDASASWKNGITLNGSYTNSAINIPTSAKLCLDGLTCANAISQTGGAISLTAPGGVLTGALLASSVAVTGNVDILAGQKLCLDGTTCANTISQSGGTVTVAASAAALPATTAPSLTSTGPIVVSTNQKVCLNGSSCTIYILYDGVAIGFYNSGAAKFQMNMSTGTAGAAGPLTSGVSTGVNCSGSPTGSHQTVGGLTRVC